MMANPKPHLIPAHRLTHRAVMRHVDPANAEGALKSLVTRLQQQHFTEFLVDHLDKGEYARLVTEMMMDEYEADDVMQRVSRALATWGTARPHAAVITLSLYTGHNWRMVRHKLLLAGIDQPMALPSLHAVLDVTEEIIVEALAHTNSEREGPPTEGERAVKKFYDSIYRPDPDDFGDFEDRPIVPSGFEDPDMIEDNFDAFIRVPR